MTTRYLLGVFLIFISSQLKSQTFTASFEKQSVGCASGVVCYNAILSASEPFDLGSYNLSFFYDCSSVEYVSNSANVDHLPSSYAIIGENDRCFDLSGSGDLPFEQTLSLLEIGIDFTIVNPISIENAGSVILQNLCFNILDDDILLDPETCFDLIWANSETSGNYGGSITTISSTTGSADVENSTYLALSDANNCFERDCTTIDDDCIPIVDADQDEVCDVGANPDPDPTDPCIPNFTDADQDGVCDINDDPDPNDPCIPNIVDADGDGICDIGDDPDPDPTDPCDPDFTSPICIDPMIEFGLSFSEGIINCDESTVCYTVNMEASGRAFFLGSYNLRLFYDGDLVDAVDLSPNLSTDIILQNGYSITSINDMQGGDQSGNGGLSFDDNLDILDISIDYLGANAVLIDTIKRGILFDLCFNITDRNLITDLETCLDLVWVNAQTQENYTTGQTTVNVASNLGITADLDASIYEDLNRNENCFEFACIEDECAVIACNDNVQISLDTCAIKIDPDHFLEAPRVAPYTFELFTLDGEFVRLDSIFGSDNGQTYSYKARCLENSCWGTVTIEANIFPEFNSPCTCKDDSSPLPVECRISCATGRLPEGVLTVEEVQTMVNHCDPNLISDLQVRTVVIDTFCQGDIEEHQLIYSAIVLRHGEKERVDILCQRYGIDNIFLEGYHFDRFFKFPDNLIIECDQDQAGQTDPDTILSMSTTLSDAFPYFLGPHRTRIDTQIIEIDRIQVQTGIKVIDEKLVAIEGVGDEEDKWVLITEVKPIFKDSIVFDTIEVEVMDEEEQFLIRDKVCNVVISFSDTEFFKCGDARQIFRRWNVYDWCNQTVSQQRTQVIEVVDTQAPELIIEAEGQEIPIQRINDVQAFIEPWTCVAHYTLPELNVRDNCNSNIDIVWSTSVGTIVDNVIRDIPKNNIPVEVTATLFDKCENESSVFFRVSLLDTISPAASCLNQLVVSLTTDGDQLNGLVRINAEDLSQGSNDNGCDSLSYGVVSFLSPDPQKALPQGSPTITFTCTDLGRDFSVILIVQDEARNRTACETNIIVQNSFDPNIICTDIEIDCGAEPTQQHQPQIIGDFCNDFLRSLFVLDESEIIDCRQNGVTREWYLDLDGDMMFSLGDPTCVQQISFSDSTLFDPLTIKWPKHYDGSIRDGERLECDTLGGIIFLDNQKVEMGSQLFCEVGPTSFGRPEWCRTECGLVAASLETDTIFTTNFCLQLINRWTVIDWCTFQSNGSDEDVDNDSFIAIEDWAQNSCANCETNAGPQIQDSVYFKFDVVDEDGYYSYEQIIKVKDDSVPVITAQNITVNITNEGATKSEQTNCVSAGEIKASAEDFCGDESIDGSDLKWKIIYDNGDTQSDFFYTGSELVIPTLEGVLGTTHLVELIVTDQCGNSSSENITINFIDNTPPTPLCIQGVTTAFMADSDSVSIWANDFDLGSFDKCSSLLFSILPSGHTPLAPDEDGFESQKSLAFSCEDHDKLIELDLWVWDQSANGSFCKVEVVVNGECEAPQASTAIIKGTVLTEWKESVEDVVLTLNTSGLSEYPKSALTNSYGKYAFYQNPTGYHYTILANKKDNPINGVSTLDIILMQKHILGSGFLKSPYSIIAADINNDKSVSAADIVLLRNLILGLDTDFSLDPSWRFVHSSTNFVDQLSPWPFTEEILIVNLNADNSDQDIIAVKLGDLSGDAIRDGLQSSETRNKNDALQLNIEDKTFSKGQSISIPISADEFTNFNGFQLTLNHEGLRFVDSESGKIDLTDRHIGIHQNQLTISWNGDVSEMKEDLFYLVFIAHKNGSIATALQLNSSITKTEAYLSNKIVDVGLSFKTPNKSIIQLFQNIPNPFSDKTIIKFILPETADINLSIYDINGRVIESVQGAYHAGEHSIELKRKSLESGILYYVLRVGDFVSDTYKVVVID